ncbi:MAG: acylphosphatase [Phycisphaerae bacterium]|nr:acylphosphatase [Phycisphaerae bacterium]
MAQQAKYIVFYGRVQGVGFRFTAMSIANRCELTGYVRNRADGAVEMFAQGSDEDISDCIRDIKESFAGYVRDVEINNVPYESSYEDFKITF